MAFVAIGVLGTLHARVVLADLSAPTVGIFRASFAGHRGGIADLGRTTISVLSTADGALALLADLAALAGPIVDLVLAWRATIVSTKLPIGAIRRSTTIPGFALSL